MAGLGRKTFAPGEVLRSADVNGYLMDQTVMSFAGTAARGSAIGTAVSEGMVSYLDDSNSLEVYKTTGTAIAGWEPVNLAQSPNLIINGAYEISQRGIGTTPVRRTATEYGLDRWLSWQFQAGRFSQQVVTGTGPTSRLCMRVSSSSTAVDAGTRLRVGQKVESLNTYPLRGKRVTFSFYIRFNNATFTSSTATAYGNFSAEIGYYTSSTDSNFGTSTSDTNTLFTLTNGSLPTSWTKYTVTGTVPTDANNLHVGFTFGNTGATAANDSLWYEVTDVQLEEGQTATPFRRNANSFQGELAACQRYYFRIAQNTGRYAVGYAKTTTTADITVPFPTTMRVAPTALEQSGSAGDYLLAYQNTAQACSSVPTFQNATTQSSTINFTVASGLTAGNGLNAGPNGANSFLGWNAEL
jgi:hypothetical protein